MGRRRKRLPLGRLLRARGKLMQISFQVEILLLSRKGCSRYIADTQIIDNSIALATDYDEMFLLLLFVLLQMVSVSVSVC